MNLDTQLSRKISGLSFAAMVSVVFIHSKTASPGECAAWNVFVQWMVTRTLTNWAVPFFFLVSGYFFMLSYSRAGRYGSFILKKFRTLALPYLYWTVILTIASTFLCVINNHIMHRPIFARTFLDEGSTLAMFNAFWGIIAVGPKGATVLWYVRVCLIFFALAPFWWFLVKRFKWITLVVSIGLVLLFQETYVYGIRLKIGSIGWLLIGCVISELKVCDRMIPTWLVKFSFVIWVCASVVTSALQCGWIEATLLWGVVEEVWRLCAIAGVVFMWGIWDMLFPQGVGPLPSCFSKTFWVYCIHVLFTSYYMAMMLFQFGKSDFVLLGVMFSAPFVAIALSLWIARKCKRVNEKLFCALTGGR